MPLALAEAAGPDGIHVIIDYLWGQPTEAAIAAITRRGLAHTAPRVRLVEVGQMAGPAISLPAGVLRSRPGIVAAAAGGSSSGPEHRAAIQKALWSLRLAQCRSRVLGCYRR